MVPGLGRIRKGSKKSLSGAANIAISDGLAVGDGGDHVADEDDASSCFIPSTPTAASLPTTKGKGKVCYPKFEACYYQERQRNIQVEREHQPVSTE